MKKIFIIIAVTALVIFVIGFGYFKTVENKNLSEMTKNLEQAKKTYEAIPIWHKKLRTNEDLKIGIINDTHVHPIRINKQNKKDDAPRKLKYKDVAPIRNFIADMKVFQPDFVVHLGDVIEGTGDADIVGIKGIELVRDELKKIQKPIYWVIGNHDLRSVTKEQFKQAVNLKSLTQSFDVGDYRFVILDGNYNPANLSHTPTDNLYLRGHVPPEQLEWLKKQLATNKQTFVFLHQGAFLDKSKGDSSIVNKEEEKNELDEENEGIEEKKEEKIDEMEKKSKMKQSIDNAKDLQDILTEYRVSGFFNGHMEARRYEKNKWTKYYSFTGTKKSKDYPDSYYELTITDGVPDVTMYYISQGETQIKKIDFESGEK